MKKKLKRRKFTYWLKPFSFLLLLALITYSCKRELSSVNPVNSDEIASARSWYSANNPADFSTNGLASRGIKKNVFRINFSQIYMPDWNKATSYTRLGKKVIEVPLNGGNFKLTTSKSLGTADKKVSKSSLLIFKDSSVYSAFIMTIVADSTETMTSAKLNKNSYKEKEKDFNGSVLYYDLKGSFVNGFVYKSDKIYTMYRNKQSPGIKRQSLKPNLYNPEDDEDCDDYYNVYYWNGILIYYEYAYTICYSSSGGGSGGDSGPSPGDGGSSSSGSPGSPTNIMNACKNPCLNAMVEEVLSPTTINAPNAIAQLMHDVFGISETTPPSLVIGDVGVSIPTRDAEEIAVVDANGVFVGVAISFNNVDMPNASQEYITATILHESLHAYMDYLNQSWTDGQQHERMTSYIETMASILHNMYPTLSRDDYYALAWGGLEKTDEYLHPTMTSPYVPATSLDINKQYRNAKAPGGKGTSCP